MLSRFFFPRFFLVLRADALRYGNSGEPEGATRRLGAIVRRNWTWSIFLIFLRPARAGGASESPQPCVGIVVSALGLGNDTGLTEPGSVPSAGGPSSSRGQETDPIAARVARANRAARH